jgi:hypothetical protein
MASPSRPSTPLINLIRDIAQKKGLNTAALAKAASIERSRLKLVLGGAEPLTVDELIQLSQALEISPADMGGIGAMPPEEEEQPPAPVVLRRASGLATNLVEEDEGPMTVDPFGNHAEQAMRLGFGLGCDLFLVFDSHRLKESGVPREVLAKFPANMPIKLDAAYHTHNSPEYLDEGLQVTLSFDDGLHTVLLPWDAFKQISLIPLAPDPTPPPPPVKPAPKGPNRGHLRLVE